MGIFSHDEEPDWNTVYSYKNMAEKYKSALEEIKKIAEDVESASSIRFYRIKNKINEVLK